MTKKVLVPIANGTEEIEAVCIIDVLRRAGADVTVASVHDVLQVTASRGVKIVADTLITGCLNKEYDLIALPGGMPGAENLRDSQPLIQLLKVQKQNKRWYGAICAAPVVALHTHNLLEGVKATSYPSFSDQIPIQDEVDSRVVVDGNCVTSQAPGTAIEFALKLVEMLYGQDKMRQVAAPMLVNTI